MVGGDVAKQITLTEQLFANSLELEDDRALFISFIFM